MTTGNIALHGGERINRRLRNLTRDFTPRKMLAAIRPAANLHKTEAKKTARRNIRGNRKRYPLWHPRRKGGTGNLLREIKVDKKRASLLVRSFGPHSWLVEYGHETRGGKGRVRGYPFFHGIRRRIEDKQFQLTAAKVGRMLDKAARS